MDAQSALQFVRGLSPEQFLSHIAQIFANSPPVSLSNTLRHFVGTPSYSSEPFTRAFTDDIPYYGQMALSQHQYRHIIPWAARVTRRALERPALTLPCSDMMDLLCGLPPILDTYITHPRVASSLSRWAHTLTIEHLRCEIHTLSQEDAGLHFKPKEATSEKLRQHGIQSMARTMRDVVPLVWHMLKTLLSADLDLVELRAQRAKAREKSKAKDGDEDEDDDYWRELDVEEELQDNGGAHTPDAAGSERSSAPKVSRQEQIIVVASKTATLLVVCTELFCQRIVCIISILLKSTNQRCNALASLIGISLHAGNAPERVVQMMSSMGLSLSPTAINTAITALTAQAHETRCVLGALLLVAYAFDNFDVFFKSDQPTIENAGGRTLSHLTSGTMIPLHGVEKEDLRCSRRMWEISASNLQNLRSPAFRQRTVLDLLDLHPEPDIPDTSGLPDAPLHLSRQQLFQRFVFLRDLVEKGPKYFRKFADKLKLDGIRPEDMELIPLHKTEQTPAQAMPIDESTPQGCGDAIEQILLGAGVGDPNDKDEDGKPRYKVQTDISDYVVIVHCDLASVAHLQSFMDSRALEETPWNRYQFVVIVPGLFHTMMAAVDAFHRTYIKPDGARTDSCSTFKHADILLSSKRTGELVTGPGYRQMRNIILHDGVCRRLAMWRSTVAQKTDGRVVSLEQWAEEEPGWDWLVEIAGRIVVEQVPAGPLAREQDPAKQDASYENNQLRTRDTLDLEELDYAYHIGDVARLETVLVRYLYTWRAVGKSNYANHITRFLLELHFLWPEKLRRAVRMNWLVNLRGHRDTFRGVDWVVELNNLYTKVIHGGEYSNRTLPYMLKESSLIQLYRWLQVNVEDNFCIPSRTINHAPPKMDTTYAAVRNRIEQNDETVYKPGRKVAYLIKDTLADGMELVQSADVLSQRRVVDDGLGRVETDEEVRVELTGEDLL